MTKLLSLPGAKSAHWIAIALISVLGVVLLLPAVLHGRFDAMDMSFHLRWSQQFSEQFWNGDRYPRWLHNMNAGFGSPTFFFYAPAPFYITSLFQPLFSPEARQWGQLGISITIALITSGIAAYGWLNLLTNRKAALIGAVLYMALPYHLGVNLYWRFAFAEYWALVWLPLILYFTHKLVHHSRTAIVGLSISYALLILTHLPTLVMFAIVPIAYILVMSEEPIKTVVKSAIALMLAVGLAAIYLLPAMTTQSAISMEAILKEGYFYGNNFLFSRKFLPYHNPNFWHYVEITAVLMIAVAVCAFLVIRSSSLQREARFWFGVSIVAFVMMIPISQPIWGLLPTLQRIQFPWRFNTVLLVSVTALITIAIHTAFPILEKRRKTIFTIGLVLATCLLLSNGVAMRLRLKPIPSPETLEAIAINKEAALEYRPKWVAPEQFKTKAIINLAQQFPQKWQLEGAGTIAITEWKPRDIVLRSNVPAETWVTLKQFYYPNWIATADSLTLPVEPTVPTGLLRVKIPAGQNQIQVKLAAGLAERSGIGMSAIALVALGALSCVLYFTGTQRTIAFSVLVALSTVLYFSIW